MDSRLEQRRSVADRSNKLTHWNNNYNYDRVSRATSARNSRASDAPGPIGRGVGDGGRGAKPFPVAGRLLQCAHPGGGAKRE